jgi:hypothetical protein
MFEEGTAVDGRLDTPPATVEQTHFKRVFQTGNGRGDNGLRDRELASGLRHATRLHDRNQDMQVTQFEAPTYPICPLRLP